jgi:DNA-binding response OmpR family regulator
LLLALLQNSSLDKDRYDMAANTVDVHIFRIRKRLQPFGIEITTLWSYGYQLAPEQRHRAMDLILAAAPPAD